MDTGLCQENRFSQGPFRWLTVASPQDPTALSRNWRSITTQRPKRIRRPCFQQGQPVAMFFTYDVRLIIERMKARGADVHDATQGRDRLDHRAMLNDTCGNLIQLRPN